MNDSRDANGSCIEKNEVVKCRDVHISYRPKEVDYHFHFSDEAKLAAEQLKNLFRDVLDSFVYRSGADPESFESIDEKLQNIDMSVNGFKSELDKLHRKLDEFELKFGEGHSSEYKKHLKRMYEIKEREEKALSGIRMFDAWQDELEKRGWGGDRGDESGRSMIDRTLIVGGHVKATYKNGDVEMEIAPSDEED